MDGGDVCERVRSRDCEKKSLVDVCFCRVFTMLLVEKELRTGVQLWRLSTNYSVSQAENPSEEPVDEKPRNY